MLGLFPHIIFYPHSQDLMCMQRAWEKGLWCHCFVLYVKDQIILDMAVIKGL